MQRFLLAFCTLFGFSATATAAVPSGGPPLPPAQMLRTGLLLVPGGGTNTLVRLSARGAIVVDAKDAASYRPLRRLLHRFSDLPVQLVVATDDAGARTANLSRFAASGADVAANENAVLRLNAPDRVDPPAAASLHAFGDGFFEQIGGVPVRVMHVGPAHSDGDSVVLFPDLRVVALGALVDGEAEPDRGRGGDLDGWSRALTEVLHLDFDIAVGASGPPLTRADVEAFKHRIDARIGARSASAGAGRAPTVAAASSR
jgi:cyclase